MNTAKLHYIHAVIGRSPKIISVLESDGAQHPRYFYGTGAPSASTLATGNGKFNATDSGFVISASNTTGGASGGAGYTVGDVLGGTGTTVEITVDAVTAAGEITDFHVSRVGTYTAYPANPYALTGGTGSGATFFLIYPQPDFYVDVTAPASPVLYICTLAGSKSTSTWTQVGGGAVAQFKVVSDGGDFWNCHTWDGTTAGSTIVKVAKPLKLRCGVGAIASETIQTAVYNYTYTAHTVAGVTDYYQRNVTGAVTETDFVTPAVLVGDIITGIGFSTNAPASLVGVSYIHEGAEAWAQ